MLCAQGGPNKEVAGLILKTQEELLQSLDDLSTIERWINMSVPECEDGARARVCVRKQPASSAAPRRAFAVAVHSRSPSARRALPRAGVAHNAVAYAGNNFGVDVQAHVIKEVVTKKDKLKAAYDGLKDYHSQRAGAMDKIVRPALPCRL